VTGLPRRAPGLKKSAQVSWVQGPAAQNEDASMVAAGVCGPATPPFEAEAAGNGESAHLWTGSCRYRRV